MFETRNTIQVVNFVAVLDVFHAGIWSSSQLLTDPHLVNLARDLPSIMLVSKASSTVNKYRLVWQHRKNWAARFPLVTQFPAKPFEVALYLRDLLQSANSVSQIESAIYGIRWAHHLAGVPSPTDHQFVKSAVEGCKRLLAKPVNPRDALPVNVLQNVVRTIGGPTADLADLRFLVVCLVEYAGFVRVSELLKVKVGDIKFNDSHMSINVPKRKNDQFRQGHIVNIARTSSVTCPVTMTERFIAKANSPGEGRTQIRYS